MGDDSESGRQRRDFLKQAAALAGVAGLGAAIPETGDAAADAASATPGSPPAAAPFIGFEFFGPDEAAFVETLVNILCPADDYTPNGVDCGLATFFDRQLAGPFGQGKGRYLRGPWQPGPAQMGLQLPLTPAQLFSAGVQAADAASVQRHGAPFDQLPAEKADAFLQEIAAGRIESAVPLKDWFDELVYPLFVQACFADPLYGGNHDKVFWKMIGYPGLPATHAQDIIRYRGKPYPGAASPKSMLDFS